MYRSLEWNVVVRFGSVVLPLECVSLKVCLLSDGYVAGLSIYVAAPTRHLVTLEDNVFVS